MRLLYVLHQFFPEARSGTEQYALAAAREGRRRGHEVTVLSLLPWFAEREPPVLVYEEAWEGFRVVRVRYAGALAPNEAAADYANPFLDDPFRGILARERPDAVHFFHLRRLSASWIAIAAAAGARTVAHLMDFWYLCPRFTLLRSDGALCDGPPEGGAGCVPCARPDLGEAWAGSALPEQARRLAGQGIPPPRLPPTAEGTAAALLARPSHLARALEGAHAVIAPSRFLRDVFVRNGFPAEGIRIVPYGIEAGRIRPASVARPRRPLRVSFAGVLSPWKGAQVLVEAVRRVLGPLDVAIRGNVEEPAFAPSIRALRARADGDPRVRFPGAYGSEGASDVLAETDLLVVPSLWHENTPFVILEAFAAGVPVAGSDVGGIAEIVEPGRDGFLFERGNPDALAEVLRRCLQEPSPLAGLRPAPPPPLAASFDRFEECYGKG
ncbi:MAG TPA: glycosyltransferase [Planctomycetota bacterium]|jgi:glycosyltransferase involved in cell wall biosynthesis|nr:glycosyltransferase [Planctomycetota bacterium]